MQFYLTIAFIYCFKVATHCFRISVQFIYNLNFFQCPAICSTIEGYCHFVIDFLSAYLLVFTISNITV